MTNTDFITLLTHARLMQTTPLQQAIGIICLLLQLPPTQTTCTIEQLQQNNHEQAFYLHPLSLRCEPDLRHSPYPILCETTTGQWLVQQRFSFGRIRYYDTASQRWRKQFNHGCGEPQRAWQCIPTQLPKTMTVWQVTSCLLFTIKPLRRTLFFLSTLIAVCTALLSLLSGYLLTQTTWLTQYDYYVQAAVLLSLSITLILANCLMQHRLKSRLQECIFLWLPKLVTHILHLPSTKLKQWTAADIAQRLDASEMVIEHCLQLGYGVIADTLCLLVMLVCMMYWQWQLTLLFMLVMMLVLVAKKYYSPTLQHLWQTQLHHQTDTQSHLITALSHLPLLRTSLRESWVIQRWQQTLLTTKQSAAAIQQIEIRLLTMDTLLPACMTFMLFAMAYCHPNTSTATALLPFLVASGQLTSLCQKLAAHWMRLIPLLPQLQRLDALWQATPEPIGNAPFGDLSTATLSLHQLSFHPPGDERAIVSDISLTLPAGKMIAIIGPSGAGKSTIFRLVLGLEQPTQGEVRVNGHDVRALLGKTWRQQFGVVLQNTQLLPGSIFSNIGAQHAVTVAEAWALAEAVGLAEELRAMPMQLFTPITDNANDTLSGGQRQKILIARALAAKPSILLLDEATSALDSQSQAHLQQHLQQLQITRLVIAHRYSTIREADYIYVLDQGRIVDAGTYEELLARSSLPGSSDRLFKERDL